MGADAEVAAEVARHLISANLSGHDSHGVLRWPQYVAELDRGELDPTAHTQIVQEGTVTALFDARRGLGQHSTMTPTHRPLIHARPPATPPTAARPSLPPRRLRPSPPPPPPPPPP